MSQQMAQAQAVAGLGGDAKSSSDSDGWAMSTPPLPRRRGAAPRQVARLPEPPALRNRGPQAPVNIRVARSAGRLSLGAAGGYDLDWRPVRQGVWSRTAREG